ncbi:hypothetical protein BD770DRAFT_388910 [Pilaira anomala]|nr:hypothetical protein BD770DRAFT_388910 [Pilaira anomala]
MGLRKLLSTNTTTTTTAEEKKVSRKSASSISLSKSISNWAGKEKEKLRQHSLNSKRHSQPSPTHSNGSIHSHHGRKTTNPFETTEPVTPTSGSLRDVNDVVTKRTSDSFMEDQQSWSEDMHHHQTTEDEDDYVSSPMTYDSNKHEVASFDSANDRKGKHIMFVAVRKNL